MKAYELINWLNIRHPQKFAEEWDNVGLLVGDDQKEISHVFLALDLTEPVLDEAVAAGADMILTHLKWRRRRQLLPVFCHAYQL